jgi:hypothetical protein
MNADTISPAIHADKRSSDVKGMFADFRSRECMQRIVFSRNDEHDEHDAASQHRVCRIS